MRLTQSAVRLQVSTVALLGSVLEFGSNTTQYLVQLHGMLLRILFFYLVKDKNNGIQYRIRPRKL